MWLFDRYIGIIINAFFAAEGTAIVSMVFAGVFDNAVFTTLFEVTHLAAFVILSIALLFLLIDMVSEWFSSNEVTE